MKNRLYIAIILPEMVSYGSETSFLLIFSAKNDLVRKSAKSKLPSIYFDQLIERCQPLCEFGLVSH